MGALACSLALAACQAGDGASTQRVETAPASASASLQAKGAPSEGQFCAPPAVEKQRYRVGMRPQGGTSPDARIIITRDPDHPTVRWAFFREKDQIVGWYILRDVQLGQFIDDFQGRKKDQVASLGATGASGWEGASTSVENLKLVPDCPSPPDFGGGTASLQSGLDAKGEDPRDAFHLARVLYFSSFVDLSAELADRNARECESCPIPQPNPIPGKQ